MKYPAEKTTMAAVLSICDSNDETANPAIRPAITRHMP
jgi:hypothetical protein